MSDIDAVIDQILGKEFQLDCSEIEIRGRDDHGEPYFSGPGLISGSIEGSFAFRLFNVLEKKPDELIRLSRSARDGSEPMRLTGAWVRPSYGWRICRCAICDLIAEEMNRCYA